MATHSHVPWAKVRKKYGLVVWCYRPVSHRQAERQRREEECSNTRKMNDRTLADTVCDRSCICRTLEHRPLVFNQSLDPRELCQNRHANLTKGTTCRTKTLLYPFLSSSFPILAICRLHVECSSTVMTRLISSFLKIKSSSLKVFCKGHLTKEATRGILSS